MNNGLVLPDLGLEKGSEWHAVLWRETSGSSNVEVMLEILHMKHHGIALVCHTKQLDRRASAVKCALLGIDLLEAEVGGSGREVLGDWWTRP